MERKTILSMIILLITFVGLYLPILPDLYKMWMAENGDNSHCMLVPFISAYLIWNRKKEIDWHNVQSSNIGLILLVFSLALYIVSYWGGVEIVQRITIVSTLIALIIYNLGLKFFYQISFPLFFLIFIVPAPVSIIGLISFPLQQFVTKISAFLIGDVCSLPVYMEGNLLYFASTSLEVAEACSGIRSLTAYLMLGFLFSYLMHASLSRRAILILCTIPLSVFVNIVRVAGTGILANFYGGKVARGFMHEFSGIAVFIFGFFSLYIIYYFLDVRLKKEKA